MRMYVIDIIFHDYTSNQQFSYVYYMWTHFYCEWNMSANIALVNLKKYKANIALMKVYKLANFALVNLSKYKANIALMKIYKLANIAIVNVNK